MNLIQSMFDLIALPMKDDGPADVIFFFLMKKGMKLWLDDHQVIESSEGISIIQNLIVRWKLSYNIL